MNLDGTVLSYFRITLPTQTATKGFYAFFGPTTNDGGSESLEVDGFSLITTNRDLDTDSIEALEDANIEAVYDNEIILKQGIAITLSTSLVDDCGDMTFCRLLKSNLVYSLFEFQGSVGEEETVLTSEIDNFLLPSGVSIVDSTLRLTLKSVDGMDVVDTGLYGKMVTIIEEDEALVVNTIWDFSDNSSDPIKFIGYLEQGIYENVFDVDLIDLVDIESSGYIDYNGDISDYYLAGLGVYGQDCYYNQDFTEKLDSQNTGLVLETYEISEDQKVDGDLNVDVISDTCKTGYFQISVDFDDYSKNYIKGMLSFDNPEDLLRTSIALKSDDHVPVIINQILFPHGLLLDFTYLDVVEDRPLTFTGEIDFLGVLARGQYDLHFYDYTAKINIVLPTIKIGGGNVQLITHEDLFYHYELDEGRFSSNDLDLVTDYNSLKKNNTLKTELVQDKLSESLLLLETNFLLFNMVNRSSTYLGDELFEFYIHGHPFNGLFRAQVVVEVQPVYGIEAETNSRMKMTFDKNREYDQLNELTNDMVQNWVKRIIKVTEEANRLIAYYESQLEDLQASLIPESECPLFEQ